MKEGERQLDKEDKDKEVIGDQNSTYLKVKIGLAHKMIKEYQ